MSKILKMKCSLSLSLERRLVTRASTSTPNYAVSIPAAKTHQIDRSFIHTATKVWYSLPDNVVGTISSTGLKSFKASQIYYTGILEGVQNTSIPDRMPTLFPAR